MICWTERSGVGLVFSPATLPQVETGDMPPLHFLNFAFLPLPLFAGGLLVGSELKTMKSERFFHF
jgi:hypothetical protein